MQVYYNEEQDRIVTSSTVKTFTLYFDCKYLAKLMGFPSDSHGSYERRVTLTCSGSRYLEPEVIRVMDIYTNIIECHIVGSITNLLLAVIPLIGKLTNHVI